MGKGNDMRSVKAFISVVLVAAFTLGVVSCGKAGESRETQRTLSSEEQLNKEKMEKSGAIYVMVGTDYDGKMIRVRSIKGGRDEAATWATVETNGKTYKYKGSSDFGVTWWEHDPNDYEYGDIFIANGIEPEKREVPYYNGTVRDYFFGSDVKLEKLGNCKTLMTLKKLKIESADYDGYGHWSVHLQDPSEKKDYGYYYGYRNGAYFGVDLSDSDNGTFCTFAFVGDIPIVAVEKGE